MKQRFVQQQVPTKDMVAYYKLWYGLTTAGEVFDYSLNGNLGTVTGAVPAYPGFLFDAVNDEINCGSDNSIADIFNGGGSVSVWLQSDGRGENNEGNAISKLNWQLQMVTDTTTMRFFRDFSVSEGTWDIAIVAGMWQHLVIVYDSSSVANNPIVYLNGVSITATETTTPQGDFVSDASGSAIIGDGPISVTSWDGKIGDVILFTVEKNAAAAKSIFEITRGRYDI